METVKIKIKTLLICLAVIFCVEVALFVVSRHLWDSMIVLGVLGVARFFEIIIISGITLIWGKGLASIGLALSKIFPGIKKGLIWSAGFGVLALFTFIALFLFGIDPLELIRTPLPTKQRELLLFFLVAGIVGPVAEEVFFRGVLYGFLRGWGVAVALVVTTLVFVLAHYCMGNELPVTQMVGGLLFAIAYEVEGNLMVPITIHALGNLSIFTLSLLS